MNVLPKEKRIQILNMLVEGSSIRSVGRVCGVSKNTVVKLQLEVGKTCDAIQYELLRDLPCKNIQMDEIWNFVHSKEEGDVWTWTAICSDTRLMISWLSGSREQGYATRFAKNVHYKLAKDAKGKLINRPSISSDGLNRYVQAIEAAFGAEANYGQFVKTYNQKERTLTIDRKTISGNMKNISTSYIERQNLTMRMSMRRFTRKTNAHSKKFEHHCAALNAYFMYYNFMRVHQTLRITPAMEAGITDRIWGWEDVLERMNRK